MSSGRVRSRVGPSGERRDPFAAVERPLRTRSQARTGGPGGRRAPRPALPEEPERRAGERPVDIRSGSPPISMTSPCADAHGRLLAEPGGASRRTPIPPAVRPPPRRARPARGRRSRRRCPRRTRAGAPSPRRRAHAARRRPSRAPRAGARTDLEAEARARCPGAPRPARRGGPSRPTPARSRRLELPHERRDDGPSVDRKDRLRPALRERPQAPALPGGHDDGVHREGSARRRASAG